MQKHPGLTIARIDRFLRNELTPLLWQDPMPLRAEVARPAKGIAPADAAKLDYAPVTSGFAWGPVWSDAWFRLSGSVPGAWAGGTVLARIDCGAESILWDGDDPLQGIDGNHADFLISSAAEAGAEVSLTIQATGMNPNVSCDGAPVEPSATPFTFRCAELARIDPELWGLHRDVKVCLGLLHEMPDTSPRRGALLYGLNEVVNQFVPGDAESVSRCRAGLAALLSAPATATAHDISAVGHAHIDTAWLWPLERTRQKCIHTFATATRLMDVYPDYKFVCSQAQQYEWIQEMAPKLFERIKAKIATGQWEVAGSMWVEADCNITGGESLVRQVLYGKRFFMQELGVETRDLWLPDVFGYAASLPQILQTAGVDRFLTQKISWNQTNKFPHHTFYWQGIDGTRIFTHFPPADTYNGDMSPRELAFNVRNFRDHDRSSRSLYVFGFGDGGGGPTVEMLENAARLGNTEGLPRVQLERACDFFEKAMSEAKDVPVWVGELYLELHRGTYTTQARNKWWNRKCEFMLRDAEFLAAVDPRGLSAYPAHALERAWKTVLTNQFHDIIPGSSVREVYEDSDRDYQAVHDTVAPIADAALQSLAASVDTTGEGAPALVVRNYGHRAMGEPVTVPVPKEWNAATAWRGDVCVGPVQLTVEGGTPVALFSDHSGEEGQGYTVYHLRANAYDEVNTITATPETLDNGFLRVEFSADGQIARIYDRLHDREVMEPGATGNQLQLFDDRPLFWDAWDIDPFYQEKGRVITELDSVEVLEDGPVRGALRFTRSFGQSVITQTVRLARDRNRIEFVTEVDWHESHKLLKAAFPVAINSHRATFEVQYGHVERPTHANTSWDTARFEVAAQKWVDLSEGDYGVALMNDSKYGHDVNGNTLRLTLLRSPKAPDPEADMGHHTFTYALVPHYSDFRRGGVVEEAYRLNSPPRACLAPAGQAGPLPAEQTFFAVSREGVVIEAIKKAEDEDAILVRLYEAYNARGPVTLSTALPVVQAHLVDLLEREGVELSVDDGDIRFDIKPFQIVTIRLRLSQ
jgi:alpha-mannosidase